MATAAYRAAENPITSFVEECCQLDDQAATLSGELYRAYKWWAERNGVRPVANRSFGRYLGALPGIKGDRLGGQRGWRGLALKVRAA